MAARAAFAGGAGDELGEDVGDEVGAVLAGVVVEEGVTGVGRGFGGGGGVTPTGGVVRTVMTTATDSALTLPVMSIWSAVSECGPSARAVEGLHDQLPVGLTGPPQIGDPLSRSVTFAPGSPVPETVGVPVRTVDPVVGDVMTGGNGCPVTVVNRTAAEGELTTPAAFDCRAVIECSPSGSGAAGVHDHVPAAATVAVHTVVVLMVTVTVAAGCPVPAIVG